MSIVTHNATVEKILSQGMVETLELVDGNKKMFAVKDREGRHLCVFHIVYYGGSDYVELYATDKEYFENITEKV
jgi:hypothetical protein